MRSPYMQRRRRTVHLVSLCCAVAFLLSNSASAADDKVAIEQGSDVYAQHCETCHGRDMVTTSTLAFDLRKFPKDDLPRFRASVLNGKGGMPGWRETLSDEDVATLWAYVRSGGVTR